MGKFGGWLAGVAATVISSLLVWYFTQPKPTPPPPPAPVVTAFEGMVYSGSAPVPKAMVVLKLLGNIGANNEFHDITDESGAYQIRIEGLPSNTGAVVTASAQGFKESAPRSIAQPLLTDVRVDIPLASMAQSTPLPPTVFNGAARMPVYRPKLVSKAPFRISQSINK